MGSSSKELESGEIEINIRVSDPMVARLILMLAERSNSGALEYGSKSLLDRITDSKELVNQAVEESIDQMIYLFGAAVLMEKSQNGISIVKDR